MHAFVAVRAMGGVGFRVSDIGDALGRVVRDHGFDQKRILSGQSVIGVPVFEADFSVGEKLFYLE